MELRVLGPLELVGDAGSVALAAPKQRRLLAALAVASGQAVPADALGEAVWGDSPPPSAPKLLQVYVSQLRRALPDGARIVTSAGGYALDLPPGSVDATRFERLLREGREALRDANASLAESLLTRALELWRGPAYADAAYEQFAHAEAERLEELRVAALEERAEARLRLGRHRELLAELLPLAAAEPLRERLQELAMLALYRSGRQSAALELYASTRRRLRDELGLEPRPELRELQRRILQQDPTLDSAAPVDTVGSLPTPPNALVGRQRELDDLAGLLARDDVRLVTLTGAGGSGKTRLALELARRLAAGYANGAVFVSLAPLRDSALVLRTIARAVGIDGPADGDVETIAAALRGRQLLLVLDNAEHVSAAAPAYAQLVARLPRLTLLVTSRSVLHLSGEHVYPVQPLPEDDAVELFRERACALEPAFVLTAEVDADVREICRRVDFLPLAVELAAGQIRVLSPRALRDRLTSRLSVLTGGLRDLPARQQTLRATLDWSVGLLEPHERRALAELSVFAGGCTISAAESICEAELETLSTLIDHNLVRRVDTSDEPRLLLLETIREHAAELLAHTDDEPAVRARHADWYLALAEEAEPRLTGAEQTRWFAILEAERENLRAALGYFSETGDADKRLRLTIAVSRYWYVRGHLVQARRWLERALADEGHAVDLRRRAATAAAAVCLLQGDYAAATAFGEQALAAARASDDPRFVANGLSNLGAIVLAAGDHERATELLEEAVPLAREVGDARIAALAINNLGDLALTVGDYERAEPLFEESLQMLRARGDASNVARSLFNLAAVALRRGRLDEARERLRESATLANEAGDMEDLAWCLDGAAALAAERGAGEEAALLLGAAETLLDAIGADFKPFERQLHESTRALARSLCGTTRFAEAMRAATLLTLPQALERALAALDADPMGEAVAGAT